MELNKINGFSHIYEVDVLETEFKKLFNKSKKDYEKCHDKLLSSLSFLDHAKTPPMNEPFEPIRYRSKNKDITFYRIKIKTNTNNIRVLYFWCDSEHIVLLAAFKEKAKSDYEENKALAYRRGNELRLFGGAEDE